MSKLRRIFIATLLTMTVTAAGLFGIAAPASASPSCWSGYLCLWEHSYGGGSEIDYSSGFRGQCVNLPWNWHDKVSSVTNNIGADVNLYINANCGGASLWIPSGSGWDNLGWAGFNDTMDSVRIY
jgi:hypothetical protein